MFIQHEMVELLAELVRLESPSRDKAALDEMATLLTDRLLQLGMSAGIVPNVDGGNHVVGRSFHNGKLRPALVLGHFDTVWPRGTLERMPFRIDEDGRAFGPGVFDMKASLAIFMAVIEQLNKSRQIVPRPIWVLLTSDEEIGSPTSRGLIEELAAQSAYVLVLEPALADGGLKTSRKGVGRFRLEVEGKAAHAGVAPQDGRSAIVELARQILKLQTLQDFAAGTTINVGVIDGGTTPNVVPAQASAEIDVRVSSQAEESRIVAAFQSLTPEMEGTRLNMTGSFNRPPMERTPAIAALFEQAREIGRGLGLELSEGSTGGGSDGNFTAALGVPTLDGLGARGGGAHADDEHVIVASLPERAELALRIAPFLANGSMMKAAHVFQIDDEITIRQAKTIADYRGCQDVQRTAWGISDESYIVPIATMVGANLHGGLVLGAFLPGGEAVAMSFAFLGRIAGRLCLYSQLTGVLPAYQSRGLGLRIKLLQREIARSDGVERIAWAFDPLQAGNAYFNLVRLGASAGHYVENMYGPRTDALNAGVPTDRLIVEWNIQDEAKTKSCDFISDLPRLIEIEQGGIEPVEISDALSNNPLRILVEIPMDFALLRRDSPALAERWRALVARAFQAAFAAGYRAVHFVRDDASSPRRGFYVLERL